MKCQACGASLPDNAVFCGECGSPVEKKPKPRPQPTPQPTPQPKQSNTLLIVLIIIVSMLLVAVLGLFTYEYVLGSSKLREPISVTPEPTMISVTPQPTNQVTVTPEPITVTHPPSPVFTNVSASSTRGTDYTSGQAVNYYPEYAVDGIYETAWSSNREIELTPSITLSSGTAQYVTGVRVANGYFKTDEIYRNNRRITKFLIEYEGGQVIHYCGIDQYRIMQDIRFDTPVTTNYIKVQVLESYQGKWKDIAISEIEVY